DITRVPFNERSNVRVFGACEEIAFPVPGDRAILDAGGAGADGNGILDLALATGARTAAPEPALAPQMLDEVPFERAARLHVQRAIDRLVRDVHGRVVRKCPHAPRGDLLR